MRKITALWCGSLREARVVPEWHSLSERVWCRPLRKDDGACSCEADQPGRAGISDESLYLHFFQSVASAIQNVELQLPGGSNRSSESASNDRHRLVQSGQTPCPRNYREERQHRAGACNQWRQHLCGNLCRGQFDWQRSFRGGRLHGRGALQVKQQHRQRTAEELQAHTTCARYIGPACRRSSACHPQTRESRAALTSSMNCAQKLSL